MHQLSVQEEDSKPLVKKEEELYLVKEEEPDYIFEDEQKPIVAKEEETFNEEDSPLFTYEQKPSLKEEVKRLSLSNTPVLASVNSTTFPPAECSSAPRLHRTPPVPSTSGEPVLCSSPKTKDEDQFVFHTVKPEPVELLDELQPSGSVHPSLPSHEQGNGWEKEHITVDSSLHSREHLKHEPLD
ncbi:hypothetical protein BT69DRAFT_231067 [Atractiella rhizophila]|nr:hypothetical protein BT69DRAFT_231067 [Atractiella rhizophila]